MQIILSTLVEIIALPNISWRIRINNEKVPTELLMSVRLSVQMYQCGFHLKNSHKIWSWELLRKSAAELQICLKSQHKRVLCMNTYLRSYCWEYEVFCNSTAG